MKYIRHIRYGIVLFRNDKLEGISHLEMAIKIGRIESIVSAGFVQVTNRGFTCYGESTSLGIGSKPKEDSEILNQQFKT